MGFFDTLNSTANSVGNYLSSKCLEQWAAMCKKATDDKLLE